MIFTKYIRISYNCFIVGIRCRTVGNKARFAVCVGGEPADFMGYGFAVVGGILRGIGDDPIVLYRGGFTSTKSPALKSVLLMESDRTINAL